MDKIKFNLFKYCGLIIATSLIGALNIIEANDMSWIHLSFLILSMVLLSIEVYDD